MICVWEFNHSHFEIQIGHNTWEPMIIFMEVKIFIVLGHFTYIRQRN